MAETFTFDEAAAGGGTFSFEEAQAESFSFAEATGNDPERAAKRARLAEEMQRERKLAGIDESLLEDIDQATGLASKAKAGLIRLRELPTTLQAAGAGGLGTPTVGQERKAYERAMSDPAYFAAATTPGVTPLQVESRFGPSAKLEQAMAGEKSTQRAIAEDVAAIEAEISALPKSEAQKRLAAATDTAGRWKAWRQDPVELTAGIVLESLPPSLAGATVGSVAGPAGMAAGVGLSSAAMTFASEILGNAAALGYDVRDPDRLQAWLNNEEDFSTAFRQAAVKSAVVGQVDAGTAGLAGQFIEPVLREGLKKIVIAGGKEALLQAGGGAGGEYVGSLAAGQDADTFDVAMEGIAEVASAPGEIVGNIQEGRELRQSDADKKLTAWINQQLDEARAARAAGAAAKPAVTKDLAAELQAAIQGNQVAGPAQAPAKADILAQAMADLPDEAREELQARLAEAGLTEPGQTPKVEPGAAVAQTVTGQNEGKASEATTATTLAAEPMPAEVAQEAQESGNAPSPDAAVTGETSDTVQAAAPTSKKPAGPRKGFFLRPRSDGVPDILDAIQELGGIRPPGEYSGGEYNGFREAMTGAARVLINRNSKHTPDTLLQELQAMGAPGANRIQKADDLWPAIQAAVQGRERLKAAERGHREEAKQSAEFDKRAIQGNRPKKDAGKFTAVPVGAMLEGDAFEVQGQKFFVEHLEFSDDGSLLFVQVKDGPKFGVQRVDGQEQIHIDNKSFDAGPEHADTPAAIPEAARKPIDGGESVRFSLGERAGPFTVEYGTRAQGNQSKQFETLEEAAEFAREVYETDVDFVTIYDRENNEIELPDGDRFSLGEEFTFEEAESVEQQKARLAREAKERAAAEKLKDKKAFVARGGDRLTGEDLDTTGEMFGGTEGRETRRDKEGQGSLFSLAEAQSPEAIAEATGFDYDRNMEAMLPNAWHFTDRRPGSPTRGLSVAVRRGSSAADVQTAIDRKAPEYRASQAGKTAPEGRAPEETKARELAARLAEELGLENFTIVYRPEWGHNGRSVQGVMTRDGRVTINAGGENMDQAATVRRVVREERAHQLLHSKEGRAAIARFARESLTPEAEAELRAMGYSGDRILLADEFIAKQARENSPWWRELIDKVRAWLAEQGLAELTPEETARAILRGLAKSRQRAQLEAKNATVDTQPGLVAIGQPSPMALRAYHGTPHKVDRFKTEKIGTGEGAQVYGWGLYFAENPKVAEEYSRSVTNWERIDEINKRLGDLARQMDAIRSPGGKWDRGFEQQGEEAKAEYDALMAEKLTPGNNYTVTLEAEPDELLDWDKPLSQQPAVAKKIRKVADSRRAVDKDYRGERFTIEPDPSGGYRPEWRSTVTGAQVYYLLTDLDGPRGASDRLLSFGIKGIRYLDQGSRTPDAEIIQSNIDRATARLREWERGAIGHGHTRETVENMVRQIQTEIRDLELALRRAKAAPQTYNYVVFDDRFIRIEAENGRPVSLDQAAEAQEEARSLGTAERTRTPPTVATAPDGNAIIEAKDYWDGIEATYYGEGGMPKASSRTTPQEPMELTLGTWRRDSLKGVHGRDISQLRLLDPNSVLVSERMVEENIQGRGEDAIRYADWTAKGKAAPPIEVVETDGGKMKVTNGHRRLEAAKRSGKPVLAWVSPAMDLPDGGRYNSDPSKPIIKTGLTLEAWEAGTAKRTEPLEGDFSDKGVEAPEDFARFSLGGPARPSDAELAEQIRLAEVELKTAIRDFISPPAGMDRNQARENRDAAAAKLRDLQRQRLAQMLTVQVDHLRDNPAELAQHISDTVDLLNSVLDEISELRATSRPIPPSLTKFRNDLQARLTALKGWSEDPSESPAGTRGAAPAGAPGRVQRQREMEFEGATNSDRKPLSEWWDDLKAFFRKFASPIPEVPLTGPQAVAAAPFFRGFRLFNTETARVRREATEKIRHVLEPLLGPQGRPTRDRKLNAALKRYQQLANQLTRARAQGRDALAARIARDMEKLEADSLAADPFNLFRLLVLYRDLWWRGTYLKNEKGNPITLPQGFTIEDIADKLRRLDAARQAHPQRDAIGESLRRHYALTDELQRSIMAHGEIIPEAMRNPLYFPHHILDNWSGRIDRVRPSTEEDFRRYLIAPVGSGKLIQADYLKAMYLHVADVLAHNARVDLVQKYWQRYDISERLKEEHGEAWDKPWNLPAGYRLFSPFKKLPLRMDYVLTREVLADKLGVLFNDGDLRARLGEAGQVLKVKPEDLHAALTAGEKIKWAVPAEIADALEGIARRERARANPGVAHAAGLPFRAMVSFWKRVKLFAPWNYIRYEYGNTLTDVVDKVLIADPGIAKYIGQAAKEIVAAARTGEKSPEFIAASREGVFETITGAELGDARRLVTLPEFQALATSGEMTRANVSEFARLTAKTSMFREATFRYAKFLADVDRMKAGKLPVYAGAYHESIEALGEDTPGQRPLLEGQDLIHAKAAEISLKTFGDYNSLSVVGQWLREYLIPFHSWTEVNFKYHANQLRNIADGIRGIRGGTARDVALRYAALRVVSMLAGVAIVQGLWNTVGGVMAGLWDDDDDLESKLSEADRRRAHLILGKDKNGNVLVAYTPSAFGDVAEWIGGNNGKRLFLEYMKGDITLGQFVSDYAKQLPADFGNKIAQSTGPTVKVPYEAISGKSVFPDVFDQRTIRRGDRWWKILGGMTDDRAAGWLRQVFDKDYYAPGANEQLQQIILQVRRRDPEQWAYYETREAAADWKEKKTGKRYEAGAYDAPEAEALRNFRRAIYRADVAGAERFYERLLELGYSSERFDASIRAQHPLGDLNDAQRREFQSGLSPREQRELALALEYYERIGAFDRRERGLFPRQRVVDRGGRKEPNRELLREILEEQAEDR